MAANKDNDQALPGQEAGKIIPSIAQAIEFGLLPNRRMAAGPDSVKRSQYPPFGPPSH